MAHASLPDPVTSWREAERYRQEMERVFSGRRALADKLYREQAKALADRLFVRMTEDSRSEGRGR